MTLEPMAAFFEARLTGYDDHMRANVERGSGFYRFTAEQLPRTPGCAVLDLGCGTGLELEPYFALNPDAQVTGIDLSAGMLDALRRKFPGRKLKLMQGSYFDVPLGEGCFDAAVSVESLHHFPAAQKRALYARLRRALRPGGCFLLTDYFAASDAEEQAFFESLRLLRQEQHLPEGVFCHYDTPLTVAHEMDVLRAAGFAEVTVLGQWDDTYALRAV